MNVSIYLLLGSNLGDRLENITRARHEISRHIGPIITASSLYKTAAWGKTEQPDFYNQVLELATVLTPEALLITILEIEKQVGRVREERWGPRIIDIDILFYGNLIVSTDNLRIPHPEIQNRKFTLLPLAEIAGNFIHPKIQKTIDEILQESTDALPVEKL